MIFNYSTFISYPLFSLFIALRFKEILLKIGFIEELRTTRGNKELPQTFFHYSPYSQKYVLIRLTLYHWQPCILQFCDITKGVL